MERDSQQTVMLDALRDPCRDRFREESILRSSNRGRKFIVENASRERRTIATAFDDFQEFTRDGFRGPEVETFGSRAGTVGRSIQVGDAVTLRPPTPLHFSGRW